MVEIQKLGSDLTLDEYIHGYSSPSQDAFEHSEAFQTLLAGGVGSGKNHSLNKRAVLLSFLEPDNEGMLCRYRATELETTTRHQFFEEVPSEMILHYDKSEDFVLIRSLRADKPSKIWFRSLWEPRPDKKKHAGMNLGWIGVDQLEDVEEERWNDIMGRFRRRTVRRPYMFGIINPKGHDWNWKRWIKPAEMSGQVEHIMVPSVCGGLVESTRYTAGQGLYAIVCRTEENFFNGRCDDHQTPVIGCEACRMAAAAYVGRLRKYNPTYWVKRMVDAGFDELRGAVYPEYSEYSVHNIDEFPIPKEWATIAPIDCGGDSPWAIPVMRVDPQGDVYITNEFHEPSVLIRRISNWLKDPEQSGIPDIERNCRKIIDPENKSAMLEFTQHGIYCEGAGKGAKKPGIYQVAGYMHRLPGRTKTLPNQLLPDGSRGAVVITDAPKFWVFKRCINWRREHDGWQWETDARTGEPTDMPVDKDDHQCFVAGTPISTPDGPCAVDSLRIGQLVDTPLGPRRVLARGNRLCQTVRVNLSDGRQLRCTEDHPIFTIQGYVPALSCRNLVVGGQSPRWSAFWDLLCGRAPVTVFERARLFWAFARAFFLPQVRVTQIEEAMGVSPVYSITVDEAHAYYANGVLVRNCDATIYGMRILPPVWELPEVDSQLEELRRLHYPSYKEAMRREKPKGGRGDGTGEMLDDEDEVNRDELRSLARHAKEELWEADG